MWPTSMTPLAGSMRMNEATPTAFTGLAVDNGVEHRGPAKLAFAASQSWNAVAILGLLVALIGPAALGLGRSSKSNRSSPCASTLKGSTVQ